MIINAFNRVWWVLFVTNIILIIGLRFYLSGIEIGLRESILLWLSIGICAYFISYRLHILKKYETGSPEFYNYLPLYPCNLLTFVLPLAIITKSNYLAATSMLFGTTFPLLAIFMPTDDCKNLPLFSSEGSGFYLSHYGVWALSLIYTSFIKPANIYWITRATVVFFILLLVEHLINLYFRKTHKYDRANFGFTCDRENNPVFELLYKFIPLDLFYLVPLIPVFILIGLLINMVLNL